MASSQVTIMCELFEECDFNEEISKWDTSNVEYMISMFRSKLNILYILYFIYILYLIYSAIY